MSQTNLFSSIAPADLARILGGASRVTTRSSSSTDQLTMFMTQIMSSIKDLSSNKNQSDPMQMMMMMMMMGGGPGGGGGGGAPMMAPPSAPPPTPQINISTRLR